RLRGRGRERVRPVQARPLRGLSGGEPLGCVDLEVPCDLSGRKDVPLLVGLRLPSGGFNGGCHRSSPLCASGRRGASSRADDRRRPQRAPTISSPATSVATTVPASPRSNAGVLSIAPITASP